MPPAPSPPKPAIDLEQFKALMEEKQRHVQQQKRQQLQQQQPKAAGREAAVAGGSTAFGVAGTGDTMQLDAVVTDGAGELDIDLDEDGDDLEIIPQSQVSL